MNPISRFRTRARSDALSSLTSVPLSRYVPVLGESSKPRIESSVDLPHPDGPEIDTYSPRAMCRLTSSSACVSTSSVTNSLVRWSREMTGGTVEVGIMGPLRLLQPNAIECIPRGHIRQNHLIADRHS